MISKSVREWGGSCLKDGMAKIKIPSMGEKT